MAWQDKLFEASFRGVAFEVVSETLTVSHALSVKQPPFADDAVIDDLGVNPESFALVAKLSGADYETRLEALQLALRARGAGELVHPIYGSLKVQVDNYDVGHVADEVDACTVNMRFSQPRSRLQDKPLFVPVANSAPPRAAADIVTQPAKDLVTYQEQLKTLATEAAIAQRKSLPEQVRDGLRVIRRTIGLATTTVDDLTSPPGWIGGIISEIEGIVRELPIEYDPMAAWRRLVTRIESLGNVFASSDIAPLSHTGIALNTALIAQSVTTLTDVHGQRLSPKDYAAMRSVLRARIQSQIIETRTFDVAQNPLDLPVITDTRQAQVAVLKEVAASVYNHIQALIDSKPPLINHIVERTTSLRLLAHELYADYNRAEELARLNAGLVNPAIIKPGTQVNAYAR